MLNKICKVTLENLNKNPSFLTLPPYQSVFSEQYPTAGFSSVHE